MNVTLENWYIYGIGNSLRLSGTCKNHPKFADDSDMITSEMQGYDGEIFYSQNNSYELGIPEGDWIGSREEAIKILKKAIDAKTVIKKSESGEKK